MKAPATQCITQCSVPRIEACDQKWNQVASAAKSVWNCVVQQPSLETTNLCDEKPDIFSSFVFRQGVLNMERLLLLALSLALLLNATTVMGKEPQAGEKAKVAEPEEFKGVITPALDRCSLDIESRSLKPLSISRPNMADYIVKDVRIQVDGSTVRAFKVGEAKPLWETKSTKETQLALLATDEKVIYLAGYRPEPPLRVRRLEIASGKWLDDLGFVDIPGPKKTEIISNVLTSSSHVIVLSVIIDGDEQLVSYQIHSFKSGETKPIWSTTFPSAGKTIRPGAFLLSAARSPAKVQPDVQPLTWLGENVLVCAGPVQDLLCLEAVTGKQRWKVERVWEFERGFIGPSVWQHIFTRSGRDVDDEKQDDKKDKKDALPNRQNSIVGGPIVVDLPKNEGGKGDKSIFIAVAKGPLRWGEYLSDCVVYELGSDGKPVAMVNLPRMIKGGQYQVQKDGVVWVCQGGAFVKVGISRQRGRGIGFGPGGPDLLCRLDWYRHLTQQEHESWLTSDPAGAPLTFGKEFAFSVSSGGYITKSDAGIYNFPLSMIDLKTGIEQSLELHVPYTGKMPEPKSNFSNSRTKEGTDQFKTMGPYVLAITWLQVEGNRLRVTVGMQNGARTLDFDIDELKGQKQK
jgi:hypothetical protein